MKDLYCSMIHGGLNLNFKSSKTQALVQHCCLRNDLFPVEVTHNFWKNPKLEKLRETNKRNLWDSGCKNCERLESSHMPSFRTGMNDGLQIFGLSDLSGPVRIDLMFDISCNLACRSCGPISSTYWQKHLKENKLWNLPISVSGKKNLVIDALSKLDLSNLRQLVFCGGETLLGQEYWDVAKWLADHVPNAKQQLTLCFQTNGTQSISSKHFETIGKFHLVKLHISVDGVEKQFEYLRWPASWNQVVDNLFDFRQNLPDNVMFVIEETVSVFNLFYLDKLQNWVKNNFTTNRFGDIANHSRHLANGQFSLSSLSQEYVESMQQSSYKNLIDKAWSENHDQVKKMLQTIKQFDQLRNESFEDTFPEIQQFYARFW
jgi:sulfatase maturation enzyme AslB (radical SAM superfamily)